MTSNGNNKTNNPYASSSFIGHSLWLVPSSSSSNGVDVYEYYDRIIKDAAEKYGTPTFTPHITLLAAITTTPIDDIVKRTKILASRLAQELLLDDDNAPYIEFEYESLGQKDLYFQCVYAKMKCTKQILRANEIARQIFPERNDDPPYMPHMSLVYGDSSTIVPEDKESILQFLEKEIIQEEEKAAPPTTKIPIDRIEIWSTKGYVHEWYLVKTVPLLTSSSKLLQEEEEE